MVSGFLSCFELKSALAELRSTTGSLEAVLLPFLHPRITREESGFLKCTAQLGVCNDKRTGDAMADRTGLTGVATAVNIDVYVERGKRVGKHHRRANNHLEGFVAEIILNVTLVDGDIAAAGEQFRDTG